MALKFLNKKGWHTGSLRNIETVWKAEQKHNAEEKKLDELRKQIAEERERSEFRQIQEQAGLVPRQERLDFLYESGLAVGKISEGFKELEPTAAAVPAAAAAEASSSKPAVPGALFEEKEKPQSANDAWRKLHTDPLLLIRQREKEAIDRIKNNPMKMAMIKKSVEADKIDKRDKKDKSEKKGRKRKHKSKHSSKVTSDSEGPSDYEKKSRKKERSTSERHGHKSNREREPHSSGLRSDSEDFSEGAREGKKRGPLKHSNQSHPHSKHGVGEENRRASYHTRSDSSYKDERKEDRREEKYSNSEHHGEERRKSHRPTSEIVSEKNQKISKTRTDSEHHGEERRKDQRPASNVLLEKDQSATKTQDTQRVYGHNRRQNVPKLSEEERASRLREMQLDAELHEDQRWKRLKKAADADAKEDIIAASSSSGKNFLDAAQRSIYGAEKGGSSTIEESVRRRAYYSKGGSADHESNAFRR